MDGSDGLAGGMALVGFGVYATGAAVGGDLDFALVNLAIAAAAAGFLVFNFPPARVFMGDAGSIPRPPGRDRERRIAFLLHFLRRG